MALQVRDLEASKRFYMEELGLRPAPSSPPHAVVFATDTIPFALREPVVPLDAPSHLGWGMVLWMSCDDPDRLHERLVGAGVKIVAPLQDGPFGRFFTFSDPDGYGITAHARPASRG
jgi:predicted enzyme related to lactoylglutathione lyase